MQIGPFVITRRKASGMDLVTPWPLPGPSTGGFWPYIRESFGGAWQRGISVSVDDSLTHPTFWSCVTLIAGDIAKMRVKLVKEGTDGICQEVTNPAYSPVLRKPNHYQNRIQFYAYWILSKLTRGNAYALKERDARGVVTALYLLNPLRVQPMVSPSGEVFYALQGDPLSGLSTAGVVVPAREIIHDTMFTLYHPLVGLSPVYACGHAAMQGLKIVHNTTTLFENGSQVGGVLTAPGPISDAVAKRMQEQWEQNYAGPRNIGKVAVLGDGLKFDKPPVMSAVDAQLIDQLKWGDEKICSTFHVPAYMVGVGPAPLNNNVEDLQTQYYGQCLQVLIESLELCLCEGLELNDPLGIELDLDGLIRMDSSRKMDMATKGVVGGVLSPDEARAKFNLSPVPGGNTPYLQQQNYSLEALAKRDAMNPLATSGPNPSVVPPSPSRAQLVAIVREVREIEKADGCMTCHGSGLLPERCMGDPQGQLACPDCAAGAEIMAVIGDQVDDIEGETSALLREQLAVVQ